MIFFFKFLKIKAMIKFVIYSECFQFSRLALNTFLNDQKLNYNYLIFVDVENPILIFHFQKL